MTPRLNRASHESVHDSSPQDLNPHDVIQHDSPGGLLPQESLPEGPPVPAGGQVEPPVPKRTVDISATSVAGGALAAMTAAALGSRLGVAGTVAGAAVASIVAAVASALYTASLRSTQARVRTVLNASPARPVLPRSFTAEGVGASLRRFSRRRWKSVLVGTIATFGLTGVVLTGLEAISGRALSGGSGTTVSQVSSGRSGDSDRTRPRPAPPKEEPSPTGSDPTPSAGSEDSPAPADPPDEPAVDEPTSAPTEEPTASGPAPSRADSPAADQPNRRVAANPQSSSDSD